METGQRKSIKRINTFVKSLIFLVVLLIIGNSIPSCQFRPPQLLEHIAKVSGAFFYKVCCLHRPSVGIIDCAAHVLWAHGSSGLRTATQISRMVQTRPPCSPSAKDIFHRCQSATCLTIFSPRPCCPLLGSHS